MLSSKLFYPLCLISNLLAQDIFSKTDFTQAKGSEKSHFYGNVNILFLAGSVKGYQDSGDIEDTEDFQVYPIPVASADLNYNINNITLVSRLSLGAGLGVGINYKIADISQIEVYYIPKQESIQTFALDPLNPNNGNKGSDYNLESFTLGVQSIYDSPLSVLYTYSKVEVLNDNNGFSRGLTPEQIQSLQRSFESHAFELSYETQFLKTDGLQTTLHYTDVNAKGKANSFDMLGVSIGTISNFHKVFYGIEAYYKHSNYIQVNPLKNIKEVRIDYGANLYTGYQYTSNISFYFSITTNDINSNIDTYDQEVRFISTGLSYDF